MKKLLLILFSMGILCSCEEKNPPLGIPDSYNPNTFIQATAEQTSLINELSAFTSEVKKGRAGAKINGSAAENSLNKLSSSSSAYYMPLVKGWLSEAVLASGGAKFGPGNTAGVFGGYLLNKYGIEYEQLMEKGLYNAALFNTAYKISKTASIPEHVDQILKLYGAHPDFANSNDASLHTNPDTYMANYIARRDKNDGKGLYTQIKADFLKAKAATQGGAIYNKEKQAALEAIFKNWEKGCAATVVNYLYAVIGKFSSTTLNEATVASGLHSYSEVLGFIHGLKTLEGKTITDAQINEILLLLNAPVGSTPTTLNYLTQPVLELKKIETVLSNLKAIYGFTDAEMKDFEKNWVSEQKR